MKAGCDGTDDPIEVVGVVDVGVDIVGFDCDDSIALVSISFSNSSSLSLSSKSFGPLIPAFKPFFAISSL